MKWLNSKYTFLFVPLSLINSQSKLIFPSDFQWKSQRCGHAAGRCDAHNLTRSGFVTHLPHWKFLGTCWRSLCSLNESSTSWLRLYLIDRRVKCTGRRGSWNIQREQNRDIFIFKLRVIRVTVENLSLVHAIIPRLKGGSRRKSRNP